MSRMLLVATRNRHKTDEIRAMLGAAWVVEDLLDHPDIPEIAETGATFRQNAALKALETSRRMARDVLVLSDDSGLDVDALDGAPGVYSSRYAGADASDAENRAKLRAELERVDARGRGRAARFRCVMVLARGGRELAAFEGAVEGVIGTVEKGDGGFGYDSLFIPAGFCATFAELPAKAKNGVSHRARALEQAVRWLAEQG